MATIDPTIIMKIARALGQATNVRGVGMLGPLSKGLAEDPEILKLLQAASKYAKGISPKVLQDASAEYADLLQSAATHFKRGMPSAEVPGAAKRGIDEFLASAQDKLTKYRTKAKPEVLEKQTDPESIFARLTAAEEGSSGLGAKAKQIYEAASPRLKEYLDHIVDPTKPRPKGSRGTFQNELRKLRGEVTGKHRIRQATRGAEVGATEEAPVAPVGKVLLQKAGPPRGKLAPDELESIKAKAEASVPEGESISGALFPGFEPPRPLAEPISPGQVPIRGEFGPLDVPSGQEVFAAFKRLFMSEAPKKTKKVRSLKTEVTPE